MTATYASLKTRALQLLNDATAVRYTDLAIQEAMRQALAAYTSALPQLKSAVLTVATAGATQSLGALSTLTNVVAIIYPYSTGMVEKPTQRITYFVYFDGGVPYLYLPANPPSVGEQIKIVYFASHTINGLDSSAATTLLSHHETHFCRGVAAFACQTRAHALLEAYGDRSPDYQRLMDQGKTWEDKFKTFLAQNSPVNQFYFPEGFKLDQWDQ